MSWKSTTFKRSSDAPSASAAAPMMPVPASPALPTKLAKAIDKHRNAMTGVILEAKKLADDRQRKLDAIRDPELKRSAAR